MSGLHRRSAVCLNTFLSIMNTNGWFLMHPCMLFINNVSSVTMRQHVDWRNCFMSKGYTEFAGNAMLYVRNQNNEDPSRMHPMSQAGHHTHHTTTCVHIPHTSHPKAASVNTVSTDTPVYQHTLKRTAGGERRLSSTSPRLDIVYRTGIDGLWRRSRKLRGTQRRPIMKEREKLRVARVESDRPNRRRANDLIKRYC